MEFSVSTQSECDPLHLQWLYWNRQPGNHFKYGKEAGTQSFTATKLTQNAGSEKKDASSGSYDYIDVMCKLDKQSNKKIVEIEVGNQTYILKNPYHEDAYELSYNLADQIYDSVRNCDTYICDIAESLGFKADNIRNVKDLTLIFNKPYLGSVSKLKLTLKMILL